MQKEILLTAQGLKALEDELDFLKTVKRKEMAEKIALARSYGDLSENSEYDDAKNEQAQMEARIADIEVTLKHARVIDENEISNENVHIGSVVTVYNGMLEEEVTYNIVSASESDPEDNKISDESVWSNGQLLDEYVNGWYRNMNYGFKTLVTTSTLLKNLSRYYLPWFGDQLSVGKTDWFNAGYGDILKGNQETITNWALGLWTNDYTEIQYINSFLENEDKVPDASQRVRVDGEAHFMRGYYYYMLWRQFGGVLLIDHTYDPLNDPEKFPRASYQQMVDFIAAEADKAAAELPVTYDAANTGRATKGAALLLKAKAYLWASSEVYQNKDKDYLGFTDDQSQAMLQKAKAAYDEFFALNAYSLVPITATTQDANYVEWRIER